MSDPKIKKFLRKNIFNPTKAGDCCQIVLRHYSPSGSKMGAIVETFEIEKHHSTDEGIEDLQRTIEDASDSEAQALTGVQSYVLQSYHGDNTKYTARLIFRRDGNDVDDEDSLSSEDASAKGLVAQAMRHQEINMKHAVQGTGQAMQYMTRIIASQAERLEKLENERLENIETFRKLMMEDHTIRMEQAKVEHRKELTTKLMENLKTLAPVVMQKMLGGKTDGADNSPVLKEGMGALFGSMNDEQKKVIFETLNDSQRALLMELFAVGTSN